jgi:glucose-6-phosphate-specific signal transduction histidine kinase
MINITFRLLLTFNATSLLAIIFMVQKGYTLSYFLADMANLDWLNTLPNAVSYVLYVLVPLLSTGLSILLSSKLGKDDFKQGEVASIEHANNSFLPSYLGYFFVALSIGNWETLAFVYAILFAFTFLSQALYFNPLFLIFGYEFYNITTRNGTAIFLISRHKYKKPDEVVISKAFRINNYTFIERG